VKAAAHLPLLSRGDNVIGLLNLDLLEPHRFSENDRLILELFASQAAIAVENARLYGEMERMVRERTDAWQRAQERANAAEKLVLMSEVAAEFAHRMNNLAGTIPARVALAKENLDPNRDARAIRQLA